MGARAVLTDAQWAVIEGFLPPEKGAMGRPATPHRPVVEGIIYRYRAGIPWRDLPVEFGPWQTVWKRHHRWSYDGTWDRVLADADAAGVVDWKVSADASVVRAHQHATNMRRDTGPSSYTGAVDSAAVDSAAVDSAAVDSAAVDSTAVDMGGGIE
jgi:transposase